MAKPQAQMNNPRVSVVITSYNKAGTLMGAINSVLAQTYTNIELIIVDDGSTDGSAELLDVADLPVDSHRYFLGHRGMMYAFAFGFSVCRGEYIATLDADDAWTDKHKIEYQVSTLESSQYALVCQSETRVTFDSLLYSNPVTASSMMFHTRTFVELVDFNRLVALGFICQDLPILLEFAHKNLIAASLRQTTTCTRLPESISNTHKRTKRLVIVSGIYHIRLFYVLKYGCKWGTIPKLLYRIYRDLGCIITGRWTKY